MLGLSSFQAPTSIVTDPVLSELLPEMTSLKLSGKDRAEERRVEEDKTEERLKLELPKDWNLGNLQYHKQRMG